LNKISFEPNAGILAVLLKVMDVQRHSTEKPSELRPDESIAQNKELRSNYFMHSTIAIDFAIVWGNTQLHSAKLYIQLPLYFSLTIPT
jgi:hypothetical protein